MERFEITKPIHGICYMIICVEGEATDKEILDFCNQNNPAGTEAGWCKVIRENNAERENQKPLSCGAHKNRTHFMVAC